MPEPEISTPERRSQPSDRLGYAVAVIVLVIGGALARTPVLNWISGPSIVITCVVVVGNMQDRRARTKEQKTPTQESSS